MNFSKLDDLLYQGGAPDYAIPHGIAVFPDQIQAVLNLFEVQDVVTPGRLKAQLWLPIDDGPPFPGVAWLDMAVNFVDVCIKDGWPTYVHCAAGISRSGLVTVAYFMKTQKMKRDVALARVQEKRPICNPNAYFMDGLKKYGKALGIEE